MPSLTAAHRGYEYQDLMAACRLVDVLLGFVASVYVDEKLVPDDRFDDLTILEDAGHRERTQFKHTDNDDLPLTLETFTNDSRDLRLDRLVAAATADRDGPGSPAPSCSFRVVLRDAAPADDRLLAVLKPASPDPGPFLDGMSSSRWRFDANALWTSATAMPSGRRPPPFAFLATGDRAVSRDDLDWLCERLVIELQAPAASGDLIAPGPAEKLLLGRLRADIGAESYPNVDRSAIDVADAMIRTARVARQGRIRITAEELLRRTQLRHDFGAVARAHPIDRTIEVPRTSTVSTLTHAVTGAIAATQPLIIIGPPGQGKSWICQQLMDEMARSGWLIAEHYCYLGDADRDKDARVLAEAVFGSLLSRLADADSRSVSAQRPRFTADEDALVGAVQAALALEADRPIALVIDGLDHVTRVRGGQPDFDPSLSLCEALSSLEMPQGSVLIVLSQPGAHLEPLLDNGAKTIPVPGLARGELQALAARLGITAAPAGGAAVSALLTEPDAINDFIEALEQRSEGNALYATYLCREALRHHATVADPASIVRQLPPFDGTLEAYYQHLYGQVGDRSWWVAEVLALIDFAVTRGELREIRPDAGHRIDTALEALKPVLTERAAQGGVRVYHESFARFIRRPLQASPAALNAVLGLITTWLSEKGLLSDPRAFRSLLALWAEAGQHRQVVDAVDKDFVAAAIAAGFPASATAEALAVAAGSAARLGDWGATARCVELARAAETFQYERYDSAFVDFADVAAAMLKVDVLAERLLHDGRTVMSARAGLRMCAAVDQLGGVAPWQETWSPTFMSPHTTTRRTAPNPIDKCRWRGLAAV
jgi:hypothetical protein